MNTSSLALRRRALALPLLLGFLVLDVAGCRRGGGGGNDALVRLINAAPDAQDLSVAVDGRRVWQHSSFRSSTGYGGLGEGTYQIDVTAQQGGQRLTGRSYLQCRKGQAYTVVAFSHRPNVAQAPTLRIFSDPREAAVPANKIQLRLINGAGDLGSVDVLFNNIVGLQSVAFGSRSEPILLEAGWYDVKLYSAGSVDDLTAPVRMGFRAGRSYTLVAMGRRGTGAGSQALSVLAYPDAP